MRAGGDELTFQPTKGTALLRILTGALALALVCAAWAADNSDYAARVDRVLAQTPLIDGHNDLPWEIRERFASDLDKVDLAHSTAGLPAPEGSPRLMTDIPRLRAGGLGAQFWSVYIPASVTGPAAVQMTLEQIDLTKRMCERYPADFGMAYTAADIVRLHKAHRIACLIGVEGGHQINDSLAMLRQYYDAGARYVTLTHSANTAWADSATDNPQHHGLTAFGLEVVREMNRVGMLVDLAHVSEETMRAALKVSEAPVFVIHSEDDQIVPYADSAPLTVKLLKNGTLKTYKDLPHGCCQTHPEIVNPVLLAFLRGEDVNADRRPAAA